MLVYVIRVRLYAHGHVYTSLWTTSLGGDKALSVPDSYSPPVTEFHENQINIDILCVCVCVCGVCVGVLHACVRVACTCSIYNYCQDCHQDYLMCCLFVVPLPIVLLQQPILSIKF